MLAQQLDDDRPCAEHHVMHAVACSLQLIMASTLIPVGAGSSVLLLKNLKGLGLPDSCRNPHSPPCAVQG
jgi:hypothetical protein